MGQFLEQFWRFESFDPLQSSARFKIHSSDFVLFLAVFSYKFSRSTFFSRLFAELLRLSSMQHYKVLVSTISTTKRKKTLVCLQMGFQINTCGETQ